MFAATANAVVFQQGKPVFSDVDSETLLIDPSLIEKKITSRTKAIIAVDYAGQPCDYGALKEIADRYSLTLIADACHSLGAEYKGQKVGTLADLNIFSFHPVKHITTGEGGMITTANPEFAKRMRMFRNHCIDVDHIQRAEKGTWFYEVVDLGYNYRITDFQCALGISQLRKLPEWIKKRQNTALQYDQAFKNSNSIRPLQVAADVSHAYHLYVIRLTMKETEKKRAELFKALRSQAIGVNVHYIPVHLHPYYKKKFGASKGLCPVAESAYSRIISLPMFQGLGNNDIEYVISSVLEEIEKISC
jgi:dTDP-4-amino-4,6-dideoxygalactose transaminase